MTLEAYQIDIYSGQTDIKKITITSEEDGIEQINYLSVSKSVQDLYQHGILKLINVHTEPALNDKVVINVNDTQIFTGSIHSIKSDYKGFGSREIRLVGKTYDLYRHVVGHPTATPTDYGNDTTFNIISDIISTHTDGITMGTEPPDTENYEITGTFDLQFFSVGEAIELISKYDDYSYYLDDNNILQYFHPTEIQATFTDDDILRVGRTGELDIDIAKKDNDLWNEIIVVGGLDETDTSVLAIEWDNTSIGSYGKFVKIIRDMRIKSSDDAELLAQKYLDEHKDLVDEGTFKIDGNESLILEADIELDLEELGVHGTYAIKKLTHIISIDEGFITKIDFGRVPYNPSYDIREIDRVNTSHDRELAKIGYEAAQGARVFYQLTAPTELESKENDLWIDSDATPEEGGIHKLYIYRPDKIPKWQRADNFAAKWDLIEDIPENLEHPTYINKSLIDRNTDVLLDAEFENTYDQDIMITTSFKVMISGVSDYGVSIQTSGQSGWETEGVVQFSEEEVGQFKGIITDHITFVVPKGSYWRYQQWGIGEEGSVDVPYETIVRLRTEDD
jgi:hypothetical protein